MENKQSSIDFIFNAFNLLSDSDFKAWMLNNYDVIKAMYKDEIKDAWVDGYSCGMYQEESSNEYYNEIFEGNNE
jgi:hypothetical protein